MVDRAKMVDRQKIKGNAYYTYNRFTTVLVWHLSLFRIGKK